MNFDLLGNAKPNAVSDHQVEQHLPIDKNSFGREAARHEFAGATSGKFTIKDNKLAKAYR
jgi:hypothetical protein